MLLLDFRLLDDFNEWCLKYPSYIVENNKEKKQISKEEDNRKEKSQRKRILDVDPEDKEEIGDSSDEESSQKGKRKIQENTAKNQNRNKIKKQISKKKKKQSKEEDGIDFFQSGNDFTGSKDGNEYISKGLPSKQRKSAEKYTIMYLDNNLALQ
jgi:hypothetical protein